MILNLAHACDHIKYSRRGRFQHIYLSSMEQNQFLDIKNLKMLDSVHPKVTVPSIWSMVATFVNAKVQRLKLQMGALKQDL